MFWSYASVSGVKYKEMKVGLILLHNMMSWTQGRKKRRKFSPDFMRPSTAGLPLVTESHGTDTLESKVAVNNPSRASSAEPV